MNVISRDKILVVAPHVPLPKACAGDWRIFAFCRALAANKHVYLLPIKPCSEVGREWENIGVEILLPGQNAPLGFKELLKQHDFSAVIFEWFYSAHHFLPFLPLCRKVIIDTHELYFLKAQRMQETLGLQAVPHEYPETIRERELAIYRTADILLAISSEEADVLRKEMPNKRVLILPMWTEWEKQGTVPLFEARKDLVFFGSFQNPEQSPNADAVKYFTRNILPFVVQSLHDVHFHIAGFTSERIQDSYLKRNVRKYIIIDGNVQDIHAYLSSFRVFVSPLRFGAGVKKKILDAAVAGCPVVTTSVGSEGTGLRDGESIMVANEPYDFARKVVQLSTQPDLWNLLSSNARASIMENNKVGAGVAQIEQYL